MSPHGELFGRVGSTEPRFASQGDVDLFVDMLEKFERGEIDAEAWRLFRLLNGNYGQRQGAGPTMLRAKLPQGVVSADQLELLADVADRYARGFLHVTTRQNVQFHFLPEEHVVAAMRELAEAGITTREACGNSVRNVTTNADAGVADDEAFDPRPYAEAFTRYFLRHPLSSTLPRKFKVAFAGGGADHAFVLVNDIGFTARTDAGGARGFRVTVAGGTSTYVASGHELYAFLPADDVLRVSEAIVRVFHARGDRENRKKNRMKFPLGAMGFAAFREAVLAELEGVRREGIGGLPFSSDDAPAEGAPRPHARVPTSLDELGRLVAATPARGPGIIPKWLPILPSSEERDAFFGSNVARQKQPGYARVTVTLPLGDASSGQVRALARIARAYSDGTARTTHAQNVVLHWVREADLDAVFAALARIGLSRPHADTLADPTSCQGAETCKLAVTQSRGLAAALSELTRARPEVLAAASGTVVKVSGCPNGCGLHHVAGIGFQGGMRRVGERAAPHYFLYVGGDPRGEAAAFGRFVAKIPAKRVPTAVERVVSLYEAGHTPGEPLLDYLKRVDVKWLAKELADLTSLDASNATEDDFVDYAETTEFRVLDEA